MAGTIVKRSWQQRAWEQLKRRLAIPVALLRSSPTMTALIVVVLGLFTLYFAMLSSIAPVRQGEQVPLTKLTEMSHNGKLVIASFYDEDARVIGHTIGSETVYTTYPKSDSATADLIAQLSRDGVSV